MYDKLTECVSLTRRTCLQENEDLKAAKKEFNTLFVRQREEQDNLRKVGTHSFLCSLNYLMQSTVCMLQSIFKCNLYYLLILMQYVTILSGQRYFNIALVLQDK